MSKKYKNSQPYLLEMYGACRKIKEYLSATTKEEFMRKRESHDAICMQLSHLGEQVARLDEQADRIIAHFPDEVDWPGLKGLRNRIGHAYAVLDADLIWRFVNEDLTGVEEGVRRILQKRFGADPGGG